MSVAFNSIPGNLRVPFWYAEVNSGLSYFSGNSRHLILGQMLDGTAVPGVPVLIQQSNSAGLFGQASMLTAQIRIAARNNPAGEIWALPLADPPGAKATGTIALNGTPLPGILTVVIAGQPITTGVSASDTPASLAAGLAAAINAGTIDLHGQSMLLPLVAAVNDTTITLSARHTGALGNIIAVERSAAGTHGPNDTLLTITPMHGGAGVPGLTEGLAALGEAEFDMISGPYADPESLRTMQAFLAWRWDPTVQLYGHYFTVSTGNLSALTTLGASCNDPHATIMGVQASPSPPWELAAAIGAQVQLHKNMGADLTQAGEISRPMQTLILQGVRPPAKTALQWTMAERNVLYHDGISALTVTRDGQVALDRLISTYQSNAWGATDTTWLDIESLYQTVYALRFMKQQITQKHGRDALVPDNPGALQGFTTSGDIKADLIHAYAQLCGAGIMKHLQLFADAIIVEQAADPNRVNSYLPFDVVNQLRIFAVNATTFLNRTSV